jgi:hypothetical protein
VVRGTGFEPAQPFGHKRLRLTRLPVPPSPHWRMFNLIIEPLSTSNRLLWYPRKDVTVRGDVVAIRVQDLSGAKLGTYSLASHHRSCTSPRNFFWLTVSCTFVPHHSFSNFSSALATSFRGDAAIARYMGVQMALTSVYISSASWPISRPQPDCLYPPKGSAASNTL